MSDILDVDINEFVTHFCECGEPLHGEIELQRGVCSVCDNTFIEQWKDLEEARQC